MKKFSIIAVISVLFISIISVPTLTSAESCPATNTYMSNYFKQYSGYPYKEANNIITFTIKKEYLNYVKVYVNNSSTENDTPTGLTEPDVNGNINLDLVADQNKGYADTTVTFYFTPAANLTTSKNCATVKKTYTFVPNEDETTVEDDEETKALERDLGLLPDSDASLDDLQDSSFIKITDISKANKLTCDHGKNDGKTVKKYTYTSTKSTTNNCATTCREDAIVTLDPPVITQAGMCFSYVVDIKTKVACSSKYTGTKPTRYKGCISPSYCSGGTDKGGPNDEFDSCVEECDNGEYTQACINKCYTKVYEKDTTTKKTKESSKDFKEYLNRLKSSNTFIEPEMLSGTELREVNVGTTKVTCYTDSYLASTGSMNDAQLNDLASKVYYSKQLLPGGYYGLTAGYEWYPSYRYYSYDLTNGTYTLKNSGGCLSKISPYYFSSIDKTKLTIKELNGQYYYPGTSRIHRYVPTGTLKDKANNKYQSAGSLLRHQISYDGGSSFITSNCGESCSVSSKCTNIIRKGNNKYPGNKWAIVTNTQANMIYKAELKKYINEKKSCVKSSKSCYTTATSTYTIKVDETSKNTGNDLGNSYKAYQKVDQGKSGNNKSTVTGNNKTMIINTNGKCITGECDNKNQEYCSNLDKNSSDYKAYCDDKNSCKLSGIPACKNGNTCYDYHTTLSFPKNYINVKTGQTKVEITKDKLPFYVAIGNSYCTNLSTKEVNVNWYDYKIDDTNKVAKPKKINKYNITGTIRNYGYSKWNFDFSCFYALKNPDTGDCVGDNCTPKDCVGNNCTPCTGSKCNDNNDGGNGENIISKVKVRSVNLSNLFPNRTPRFNWSNEAKNVNNRNYKVDPSTLVKAIETTGDTVYDKDKENKYLDYHIKLTKSAITKIRNYNKGKTYNNSNNGSPVNRINGEGTWGVTVYRSKLLDKLGKKVVTKRGLLGCNNQTSSRSCNQQGGN